MRGSKQITNDMKYKIIEYYFRRKSITSATQTISASQVEIIDLYDEIREFVIEVGGNIWNYHSTFQSEDEAILEKEYMNKNSERHFRNFKISEIPVEVYTIWERI